MPVVNGYCTVSDLRAWMGDTGTILSEDVLAKSINAASRAIDRFCGIGRKFWLDASPITRDFKVREPNIAWVHDIGDTSGLVIQTDDIGNGSFTTLWTSGDYSLSPDLEDEVTAHAFYRIHALERMLPVNLYRKTLRITARWGWMAVPDQIHQACLMKANILVLRKDSPYGVAGFSEYGVVRLNRSEDPEITRLIAPFVRSSVVTI